MTKFADQLFDDLMREHGPALAHSRPPAPAARRITPRRTLLAAGGTGLAAAGVVAGVLVSGGGAPAYAVTKNADGTITLAVHQKSGIAGANDRLRQLGDQQVVVVPARAGCPGLDSLPAPTRPAGPISAQTSTSRSGSITVHAHGIPAGDILVVATQTTAQGTVTGGRLTSAPAPTCVSLPPPPAPPAGNGASNSGS